MARPFSSHQHEGDVGKSTLCVNLAWHYAATLSADQPDHAAFYRSAF